MNELKNEMIIDNTFLLLFIIIIISIQLLGIKRGMRSEHVAGQVPTCIIVVVVK